MEEKTQKQEKPQAQRYTYEQLNHIAGELLQQNNELKSRLESAQRALDGMDFQYSTFFISSLFKVLEHPEMYSDEFITFAAQKIEGSLRALGEVVLQPEKEENAESDEA